MRYLLTLAAYLPVQLCTYIVTPLLPAFAEPRKGWLDNGNVWGVGPRLPLWLSWFDTPDNALLGDSRWAANHSGGYWSMVGWLYRNSLYGFKWTVLAANVNSGRVLVGNPMINYVGPVFGVLRVTCQDFWQYKQVIQITKNYCLVLNFGWLLDDLNSMKALFMFSPRLKRIKWTNSQNT